MAAFCTKCGKTIAAEESACPNCGSERYSGADGFSKKASAAKDPTARFELKSLTDIGLALAAATPDLANVAYRLAGTFQKEIIEPFEAAVSTAEAQLQSARGELDQKLEAARNSQREFGTELASVLNDGKQQISRFALSRSAEAGLPKVSSSAHRRDPYQTARSKADEARSRLSDLQAVKAKRAADSLKRGAWTFLGVWILGDAIFGPVAIVFALVGAFVPWLLAQSGARHADWLYRSLRITCAEALWWFDRWFDQEKERCEVGLAKARADHDREIAQLKSRFAPLVTTAQKLSQKIEGQSRVTRPWDAPSWRQWTVAATTADALRLGRLISRPIDVPSGTSPTSQLSMPALLPFGAGNSRGLMIAAQESARKLAVEAMQSAVLRLLATIPPGKLRLLFIDPVGLGQNAAPFLPLADHYDVLVTGKAWSEAHHIEQRLSDVTEHLENVIQKYLRTEFATIDDYNKKAGETAEAYRVVVVFDFPTNFTESAARRLISIAENGPRCGVYTFIIADPSKQMPYGVEAKDIKRALTNVEIEGSVGIFCPNDDLLKQWQLEPERLPSAEIASKIMKGVGEIARDATRVEVRYKKLMDMAELGRERWWKGTTENGIRVPLGPTGARKVQYLVLGEGTGHHGLIVGRTGSGKSNLLRVIITTLCLLYEPQEIQLYLVDFKNGVGFKQYAEARLPHARAIAIESEREFGLSVLRALDEELKRRADLFRKTGADDIVDYRRKTRYRLPRVLLLVDEFQEFFTTHDSLEQEASLLLDRLARQGRGFGMHMLLASQTLAGAQGLARSTFEQIGVRIALQCSEADSRLILADDNPAARLLGRPGECIYNSSGGLLDGNSLFQVALFGDEDRKEYLTEIASLASKDLRSRRPPVVFEGNAAGSLESCEPLIKALGSPARRRTGRGVEVWLGEPTSIKQPASIRLDRQGGNNLAVVTRDEGEGVGVLIAGALSIACQLDVAACRFYIVNLGAADRPWASMPSELQRALPHRVKVVGRRELARLLEDLVREVSSRVEDGRSDSDEVYVFILGLHRARELRQDSNGSRGYSEDGGTIDAAERFAIVLREGPEVGVHVLVWCESVMSLERVIDRSLGEFGKRVAGAMNNDDSVKLLDEPVAARLDRPHRAILYDEDKVGVLEKFRPYAIPDSGWLQKIGAGLKARARA